MKNHFSRTTFLHFSRKWLQIKWLIGCYEWFISPLFFSYSAYLLELCWLGHQLKTMIWKLRFSIPRFRPEEKQARIEEMNSWFTLIGPLWSTSVVMLLYHLILYTMYKIDHYTHILPAAKIMLLNRASKLQCQPPCFC